MYKKGPRQTAADIIRRLPLHQKLSASQATLVKLSPVWISWAEQNLPNAIEDSKLNAFENGKLVIACRNAITASQNKHMQQNLLCHLHEEGFEHIQQIVFRVTPGMNNPQTEYGSQLNFNKLPSDQSETGHPVTSRSIVSESSIKAIDDCKNSVSDVNLANSLARLSKTLRGK